MLVSESVRKGIKGRSGGRVRKGGPRGESERAGIKRGTFDEQTRWK